MRNMAKKRKIRKATRSSYITGSHELFIAYHGGEPFVEEEPSVRTAEGGTETYAYDYAGNLAESVDANGGRIRYAYNSQGKVCRVTYQDGSSETFRHDREGRETEHTDRNGTVTRTAHNLYGQPTGKTCTDRDGRRRVMGTWEYDSLGRLKKAVAGGYCYTYGYRPDGKLLWKRSNGRKALSCGYYPDGSLESVTDVTGMGTRYEYDASGRLERLEDGEGRTLAEYRYTAAGRIRETRVAGGIKTTYGYDGDGNLERLSVGTEDGGTLLYDAFLLYDLNGNRTGKTGTRTGADGKREGMAVTYRYDRMNRLVCEDRGGEGERYAYDPAGNRLEREHYWDGTVDGAETYRYNERNELTCRVNRLTGSAAAYCYDACGNLLLEEEGGKKKEYGYDALNRLARVRTADGRVWENLYDGEGLRAGTRGDGACTTFLYRNGEILAECGEDGEPVSRYVYGSGLSHVQTLRDGVYHAYHRDEQGSTAYMTGPGGGVENSYRYDVFGNLLERKETVPNRVLYTCQQYDQETGQYYLRARYYNPMVGRFLQEDTYHGDGLNLYAYCANNPVVYYDPGGHDSAAVMKKAEEPDLPVGVGKGSTEFAYKKELNRLKAIRKELPQSSKYQGIDGFGNPVGNVAYSTSEIRNYNIPDLKSYSKIGSLGKNGIKNPVDGWVSNVDNPRYSNLVEKVDRNNQISPNGTLRINDTEYKIIENYNRILSGDSAASGTINIFSERKICPSCEKVIKAFSNDYPNIEINVMDSFGNLYTVLGGQKLIK